MDRTEHTSDWRQQPDLTLYTARRIDGMIPTYTAGTHYVLATAATFTADMDLIAIEYGINGTLDPRVLTRAERQATARILLRLGHGPMVAGARSGIPDCYLRVGDPDSPLHIPRPRPVSRHRDVMGSAA